MEVNGGRGVGTELYRSTGRGTAATATTSNWQHEGISWDLVGTYIHTIEAWSRSKMESIFLMLHDIQIFCVYFLKVLKIWTLILNLNHPKQTIDLIGKNWTHISWECEFEFYCQYENLINILKYFYKRLVNLEVCCDSDQPSRIHLNFILKKSSQVNSC